MAAVDAGTSPPVRPGSREETLALLRLLDLPGRGEKTVARLLRSAGSARAALRMVPRKDRVRSKAFPEESAEDVAVRRLATLDRLRVHVLARGAAGYPGALEELHDPPPALFVRGDVSLVRASGVAIVGSRRSTKYGRNVAEALGRELARLGNTVWSGLALGIDAAAHQGVRELEGRAVAVLGNGIDEIHPRSNTALGTWVVENGAVVSEHPPEVAPQPHYFPRRNRILAALSRAVVVVEAAERSGALITVDHALDLGRDIWAVPGRIDHATSRGTNRLIADGAGVVFDVREFAEGYGLGGTAAGGGAVEGGSAAGPSAVLPEGLAGVLLRVLADEPGDLDRLVEVTGEAVSRLLAVLTELEMGGWVSVEQGRYRRVA